MSINIINDFDLNKFFYKIKRNKKYTNNLKTQDIFLNSIKKNNYKILSAFLKEKNNNYKTSVITYVLNIQFSRSNTLLNVMDCSGNVKFFYSAGVFDFKGRQKVSRILVLKKFYKFIILKLKFLRGKPIAVHLKNVGLNNFWFLKKLKRKLFIVTIRNFNFYSYNGCRRKKVKRK